MQEAREKRVVLVDELPAIIAMMLCFLYTYQYDDDDDNEDLSKWATKRSMAQIKSAIKSGRVKKRTTKEVPETEKENPNNISRHGQKRGREGSPGVGKAASDQPSTNPLLRMEVNTLVYACSDKFNITSLKAESTEKFGQCLSQDSKSPSFKRAVELVFQSTAPGDSNLRYTLLRWWGSHRRDGGSSIHGFDGLMAKHEPLASKVCLGVHVTMEKHIELGRNCRAAIRDKDATIKELKEIRATEANCQPKETRLSVIRARTSSAYRRWATEENIKLIRVAALGVCSLLSLLLLVWGYQWLMGSARLIEHPRYMIDMSMLQRECGDECTLIFK